MQDDSNKDDSSVWSSYSDLFTNVAIIFLVMFVFALFKSGVNSIKQIQTEKKHKDELKGKLSEKEKSENKQRIDIIAQKMDEMKEYEDVIDSKVQELNNYAKKMQENKEVLKKVIESQLKQDSLLKIAEEKLKQEEDLKKEKELALEEAKTRIALLNEELERTTSEALQKENKIQIQSQEQIQLALKKEQELRQEMKNEKSMNEIKIMALKEEISQIKMISQKINERERKELNDKIDSLSNQIAQAKTIEKNLNEEINDFLNQKNIQDKLLQNLKSQFEQVSKQLSENNLLKMGLEKDKKQLSDLIDEMKQQNQKLTRESSELKKDLSRQGEEESELQKKLNQMTQKFSESLQESDSWKKAYDQKIKESDKLAQDLKKSKQSFQDLASTMASLQDSVKNDVTNRLVSKFKEHNLDAQVNKETGEVILLSGEGFNFQKGSSKLSDEAKNILKKVIPVYASVLFGDPKIVSQISTLNMEGHSSPSFGGKYVSPEDKNINAYSYNLRLSAMRAASVAEYLMGDEIGNYPYKVKMKSLLQAVGIGYMKPIEVPKNLLREPASEQDCGPWDCKKSQRVQINFLLKDNLEEIRKIIDSNGGIR